MSKVVDKVVDSALVVDNQKNDRIGRRLGVAREALGLTQESLAKAAGVSKRGIQENEAHDRVPGGKVVPTLISMGVNANWLLTGEGDMLLTDTLAEGDQGAAVYNSESFAAQSQAQYQTAPEPVISRIDGHLLRLCLGACAAVHGEPFSAANQFQQLEHAVDLYNLLQRLASAAGQATLEEFSRLDVGDLAQQLRIFIKMGRARDFNQGIGR